MKHVGGILLVVGGFLFNPYFSEVVYSQGAPAEKSCDCPKLACDPCSVEEGMTFYSEKCGPKDTKVRSCNRPTCIPIERATKDCPVPPAAKSGPREPVVVSTGGPAIESASGSNEVESAGKVKVIQGSVSITHTDGKKTVVNKEGVVRQGDVIESGKEGGAVIHFRGGNKVHVQRETVMEVKQYENPTSDETRKAMLNLIRGKVRNQVKQKYDGKNSYYRVTTKGAVAGVRGTDFVVEHSEGVKMETRVESLAGQVHLTSLDESDRRILGAGDGAVLTAPMPTSSDFVVNGKLSDVYKLAPEALSELDQSTRMDILVAKRSKPAAAVDTPICKSPSGRLNDCSWKCEGNPASAKVCRTDLKDVRCVRQRCNANGIWADETRMPAATSQTVCPAKGHLVQPCDY